MKLNKVLLQINYQISFKQKLLKNNINLYLLVKLIYENLIEFNNKKKI